MSTNYYFKIDRDIKVYGEIPVSLIEQIETSSSELIHIGKRSAGWAPLFKKTKYYTSVDEIISFYEKYYKSLLIVNEYDELLSFARLKEELINWKPMLNKKHEGSGFYQDNKNYYFSSIGFS